MTSAVLVADRTDLARAAAWQAEGHALVAGNHHVARRLEQAGLEATPGSALLSAADKAAILDEVAAFAERLGAGGEGPPQLRAILDAMTVRAMFGHVLYRRAAAAMGMSILRRAGDGLHRAGDPEPPNLRYAPGPGRPEGPIGDGELRGNGTILDFRSTSGLKRPAGMSGARVRPKASRNPSWMNALENGWAALRGAPDRTLKYAVHRLTDTGPMPRGPWMDDPETQALVDDVTGMHARTFHDHRAAMRGLLRRTGRPEGAIFNHVGNAAIAGAVAALTEAGVPCEMESHGCLLRTGEARHDAVARILGPAIYNSFPGLTRVAPRSPLQARDAQPGVAVVRTARLSLAPPASPFHLLYAPNFQPWNDCYHGFVIDCFDTVRAGAALARAVARTPGLSLSIRIKTTAADTAKQGVGALRGVMPEDLADCLDPAAGVTDASWGSHAEAMGRAGMVVTEGPTAVVFEALERRMPVVLLGAPGVTATLPGRPLSQAAADGTRAAVYLAQPSEALGAELSAVARLHEGAPLTDAELAPYVWTPATAG